MIEDGTLLDCGCEKDGYVGYVKEGGTGKIVCRPCYMQRKRVEYKPVALRRERRDLKNCIGSTTLVGVMGFAEVDGPCPRCGHDHVTNPKCTRWGDGVTAKCAVNDCGADLPVKDPFPLKRGNCCDILNMYTENADHIIEIMPDVAADCEVEIVELRGREWVRVVDPRIPAGYRRHHCPACHIYEEAPDDD